MAPKTAKNVHGALYGALAEAVRAKIIASNPADGCARTIAKAPHRETRASRRVEVAQFLEFVADRPDAALWRLAATTGMGGGG